MAERHARLLAQIEQYVSDWSGHEPMEYCQGRIDAKRHIKALLEQP